MEIAPDFFKYFEATSHLLDNDRTLLAVSAWNDNGQTQFVHDSEVLYRSDFFPGLGWMLTKAVWDELAPQWPNAYPFSTVVYLLFIQKL
jgi:alpha-1,3-mannosyl-glycoprotein beta-1,2-N-acetylglucosaminyltransferase